MEKRVTGDAERAGTADELAQTYLRLKQAEEALRRSEERNAFLLKLSDAIRPLADPAAIQATAAAVLGEHLSASRVHYGEITEEGDCVVVRADHHPGVPSIAGTYRLDDYGPTLIEVFRAGRTLVVSDVQNDGRLTVEEKRRTAALGGVAAYLIVPLHKEGRTVALLAAHRAVAHEWTQEEIALVEETAERTWAAVERVGAEAAVRKSEAKYRGLFDSIDAGFCIVEMLFEERDAPVDYRFLETNPAFERQTGLVAAKGRRMRELAPGHEAHWFQIYGRIAKSGVPERFENRAEQLGRWYDVHAWRHGRPEDRQVAILFNDITARKAAEDALRESEARFRTLADNMSQLAWMADENGWIFWYNKRWYDYTGTTLEEMQGWGWKKVHHPDHVERVVKRIQHSWDTGEAWEDIFPLRGRDGEYRWFLSRALPIRDEQGRVARWLGTNTDITEQRAAEAALKEADRRKNEFIAMLAHELRNPVSAVGLNAALLARAGADGGALARIAVPAISRQAKHLQRLTDDLLDIARASYGKLTLKKARVELLELARSIAADYARLHEGSSIEVEGTPASVEADPARVRQMIENLLDNAVKHGGGKITVRASTAEGFGRLSVTDNGRGISAALLAQLFTPFVQGEQTLERPQGGLGLGLALVERLAALHGGGLEAKSEGAGKGATFTFWLPAMHGPAEAESEPLRQAPERKRRILVVEDEPDSREALRLLLEMDGHHVSFAADGVEGLEKLRASSPEVALIDLGLPGLDGYELARRARRLPGGEHLRLIAMTGYGEERDRQKARDAGFDLHVTKPIVYGELVRAFSASS